MFLAYRHGQLLRTERMANPISRLTSALFRETSPVPLKYALSLLDLMSPIVRLPLVELTEQTKTELAAVITQMRNEHPQYLVSNVRASMQRVYPCDHWLSDCAPSINPLQSL
jgi:hypothetical protein